MADPTRMLMPEGSKDVYLSAAAFYGPSAEGRTERRLLVLPLISAQWANGVFINMNVVGIHLSDTTNSDYGFMLTPTISSTTTVTDSGRQSQRHFTPEAGAFYNYNVAYGLGLTSSLKYGGSSDRRGVRVNLGAELSMPVAEHHSVGLAAGVSLANRSSLQADYGVTLAQADANLAAHEVQGGLRDTGVSASWRWQVSNKYSLATSIGANRLHGSAASSPRIEQPGTISMATILTYRY